MKRKATISECGKYRHDLYREWNNSKETMVWVMLNPYTADGSQDDNTIRKCIAYAKAWNYGSFHVVNLFDIRLTDSKELKKKENPFTHDCFQIALAKIKLCKGIVLCGWGNEGLIKERSQAFKQYMKFYNVKLFCLKTNKNGEPTHPLYLKKELTPVEYGR